MKTLFLTASAIGIALAAASPAAAQTCVGNCGTLGPDGVVTAPPNGQPTYGYVSTASGVAGAGKIAGIGDATRTGSEATTALFSATAGDSLAFYFNYVTSDGGGTFTDYAFAELLNAAGSNVAYLFTARTQPTGDTSPGFGLPANDSTLTPGTSAIIPGGPQWSPLGVDSGKCFAAGCGYTGWIKSDYTIADTGSYLIRFGVTNIGDNIYASGLAYAGVTVAGVPVGGVPEPTTWAMMIIGLGAVGGAMRTRSRRVSFATA